MGTTVWIESAKRLPPDGELVFVCDFNQVELRESYYSAWYANGHWHSTLRREFVPRYWMPIPALPGERG